jgi:hypothetical protein
MKTKNKIIIRNKLFIATILLIGSTFIYAELSPIEIMQKVQARNDGDNTISTLQMQLIDKNKYKRVRELKTYSKDKVGQNYEQKLTFILSPSDVANTAFLTFDYDSDNKDDDQWMYLPALKKTKRIPSSSKDGSFMGSDFTYGDMTKPLLSDYNFKILKHSKVKRKSGIQDVWIIQSTPKTQKTIDDTGYSKTIVYVRKDNFMVTRAKYFFKNSNKIKYMDVKKTITIQGIDFSQITTMTTKDGKQTTHKTILIQKDIKINQKLDDNIFSIRSIEKGI